MAGSPQQAWEAFLDALASGRAAALRSAATPAAERWIAAWLNPDQPGFEARCATLAADWRVPLRMVPGTEVPVGVVRVWPWRRAFWWFGPHVLVRFEPDGETWRVDDLSFSGD